MSAESAYNTPNEDSGELVDSLLGGSVLNYVGHRACVRKASLAERRAKMHDELGEVARRKALAGGQEMNRLNREMRNGVSLSAAVHHLLNGTELSREEFLDNLCPRYGMMQQDIPATCDGYSKKFSIDYALSCLKGGLVLARHNDAVKEWGALGARALVPSAITYKPKINSRTVQGGRTRAGARQEVGEADGVTDT